MKYCICYYSFLSIVSQSSHKTLEMMLEQKYATKVVFGRCQVVMDSSYYHFGNRMLFWQLSANYDVQRGTNSAHSCYYLWPVTLTYFFPPCFHHMEVLSFKKKKKLLPLKKKKKCPTVIFYSLFAIKFCKCLTIYSFVYELKKKTNWGRKTQHWHK